MIKYIQNKDIDKARYDACIKQSLNSIVYGYSWYLDLVCDDWDVLVQGNYEAVFPLPFRKKFGVTYIHQPDFCQQLGLFSKNNISEGDVKRFIDKIPAKFKLIDQFLNKMSKPSGVKFQERRNLELELMLPYDSIYSSYSKNHKRNLKKAQQHKLSVSNHVDVEELIRIFRDNRGKTVKDWSDDNYQRLKRLYFHLLHNGMAKSYGVYNKFNQLIAGAIFFYDEHRAIFIFSGTGVEAKETNAMLYLVDSFIVENAESQLVLDFEGSMDSGLARFYKGFGATEFKYYFYHKNRLPLHLKPLFFLKQLMR